MPAELTSTSRRPNRSRCSATIRSHSAASETSAAIAAAPSSAAAASMRSGRRETSVSSNPSSRSIRAMASPMPDEPPVTSADSGIAPTVNGRGSNGPHESHRRRRLRGQVLRVAAVFAGADEQVRAAGAILAGGHTIRDTEPKYGLAVVGTVHPDGVWIKSGARPGDAVFLTKPLGTGLVLARKGDLSEAARWMTTLNARAAEVLRPFSPHAVTDVTGFGLLGHAHETAERSGVRIRLRASALPALEGAVEAARDGVRTGCAAAPARGDDLPGRLPAHRDGGSRRAHPHRRHRRDRPADRLGPRVPALANVHDAACAPAWLPLRRRVLEPRRLGGHCLHDTRAGHRGMADS